MVIGNSASDEQSYISEPDLGSPNDGDSFDSEQTHHRPIEEFDSTCSTPYVSAPSSPGRVPNGYFFSAPASPLHFLLSSSPSASACAFSSKDPSVSGSFEFDFSARFPSNTSTSAASMISADELFLNGQIRPMKLSSHLQRPQKLAPLLDLEGDEDYEDCKDEAEPESQMRGRDLRLRSRSLHRRTRSLSPLRNPLFGWQEDEEERETSGCNIDSEGPDHNKQDGTPPSVSASSSRSSSSGRNSNRWIFLKDLLYRSKSEGRGNGKEKFWYSISFSPVKDKKPPSTSVPLSTSKSKERKSPPPVVATTETQKPKRNLQVPAKKTGAAGKPVNGVGKGKIRLSPHELHYKTNRAQAEEMKKKTFLPYRQGLLGCLGFSSKSYGAMNGFARTLNPVSSR